MRRRFRAITTGQAGQVGGVTARRALLTALVTAAFLALLWHRLQGVDPAAVRSALGRIGAPAWGLALAATWASYWAVGRYDDAVHRHLGTGVPPAQARRAGISAIALSQVLGLGLVTGALVRWRMLPSLTLGQAARLTLAVTLLFLAGWALVTALAVLLLDGPFRAAAVAVVVAMALAAALALRPPRGLRVWPNLLTLGRMAGLAAVDCLMAALALWLLLPEAAPLSAVLPAILLALGAGLVSGTPGGIGAFEVTLIALLPGHQAAPMVAAVLAWRGVYHLLPAALATALVLRGPRAERRADNVAAVPDVPAFPEAGLMRQGQFQPLAAAGTLFAAARTPHALVALRAPLGGEGGVRDLMSLRARAAAEARLAVVYKAPARLALAARQAGWAVLALSREAWLDPQSFALERPERAPLRRKLRKAAAAGVAARCEPPDLAELQRLNADWSAAHGGEQGFSMGRFQPDYVAGQRVYVARKGSRPVGFASFHTTEGAWSLDLLRPHPAAPEGTAQALIAAALADAQRAGVARLSLAAVPEPVFAASARRGVLGLIFHLAPGPPARPAGCGSSSTASPRAGNGFTCWRPAGPPWAWPPGTSGARCCTRRPRPARARPGRRTGLAKPIASAPPAWHRRGR